MAQKIRQLVGGFSADLLITSVLLALTSCQTFDPNAHARLVEHDLSRAQVMVPMPGARVVERDLTRPILMQRALVRLETLAAHEDLSMGESAPSEQAAIMHNKPLEPAANTVPQEKPPAAVLLPPAAATDTAPLLKAVDTPLATIKIAAKTYSVPFASDLETLGPKGNLSLDRMAKELTQFGAITLRGRAIPEDGDNLRLAQDLALRRAWVVHANLAKRGVNPQHWRYYYSGKKNQNAVDVEPR